jgi:hypothetical protein
MSWDRGGTRPSPEGAYERLRRKYIIIVFPKQIFVCVNMGKIQPKLFSILVVFIICKRVHGRVSLNWGGIVVRRR